MPSRVTVEHDGPPGTLSWQALGAVQNRRGPLRTPLEGVTVIEYMPSTSTKLVVAGFSLIYLAFLFNRTIRGKLDLYNLFFLSLIAILPFLVVFFSEQAQWISDRVGVKFPFVLLFSLLLLIVFIFMHRLTVRMHRLETDSRSIIQELGYLRAEIEGTDREE